VKKIFASIAVVTGALLASPIGCAQGTQAPAVDDLDGGTNDGGNDASKDAKDEGHACAKTCTESTPYCDTATGRCVACLPSHDTCPATTYCQAQAGGGYACVLGCKSSAADCAGSDSGAVACCDHACVDTQSSLLDCGFCGNHCGGPHLTGASCQFGTCQGTCDVGYADCNNNKADGCESQTSSDPKNCGACGNDCALRAHYANATCTSGTCGGTCAAGWGDCNNNPNDGCEADLSSPQHCGSCGNVCNVANAVARCSGTTCDYSSCNANFQDCDGNRANGCESNKLGDANNCGGCGMRCPTGQGCSNGACVPGTGTVTDVMGVSHSIMMVPCGNGTIANCTQAVAESSCTSIGRKLVAHASNGTTGVVSLGATT